MYVRFFGAIINPGNKKSTWLMPEWTRSISKNSKALILTFYNMYKISIALVLMKKRFWAYRVSEILAQHFIMNGVLLIVPEPFCLQPIVRRIVKKTEQRFKSASLLSLPFSRQPDRLNLNYSTPRNVFFHCFTRGIPARVARWFVFKPKIPNLGKFWRAFEW
jgi:hypothetical protein